MTEAIDPRMTKAVSALLTDPRTVFYGTLALSLKIERRDSVKTMATDGTHLFYALPFLDTLNNETTKGVVVHEVMHCANRHHTRRNGREPKRWNVACDHAINPEIKDAGLQLPDCALFDRRYNGLTAETIYPLLEDENDQSKKGKQGKTASSPASPGTDSQGKADTPSDQQKEKKDDADGQDVSDSAGDENGSGETLDPGKCGGVLDAAPEHDKATIAKEDQEWGTRVRMAVAMAQKAGDKSGAIEKLSKQLKKATVDWREVVRRFLEPDCRIDYSWTRPNKRYLSMGYTLPGTVPDGVRHIGWIIDSSGSMSVVALNKCLAELQAALDEGAIDELTAVFCDTDVYRTQDFHTGDKIEFGPMRRGGTILAPAFEWLMKNKPDTSGIVCFSDMENNSWGPAPHVPVLFAQYGNPRYATPPTFGETIIIE